MRASRAERRKLAARRPARFSIVPRMVVATDPSPQHRLSLARIAEAAAQIDPVFTGSPQIEVELGAAGDALTATLKLETLNPIRSFKGRGADFFVGALTDDAPLVCASAGNFGQGMAHACRKRGHALTVFAAHNASPLKLARMRALGASIELAGDDLAAAKATARAWAAARGARFVEDGLEPRISEGAGTIAVELLAHGAAYDAVVVPLGDGALINGVARWIKAASPRTRIIGVCSEGAPAFARAWRGDAVDDAAVATIADGIAVRAPIADSVRDARGLVDDVVLVDDAALIAAMRLLVERAGIIVEPSGAAGVAAIAAHASRFAGASVATIATGGNVSLEQLRTWL